MTKNGAYPMVLEATVGKLEILKKYLFEVEMKPFIPEPSQVKDLYYVVNSKKEAKLDITFEKQEGQTEKFYLEFYIDEVAHTSGSKGITFNQADNKITITVNGSTK